MSPLNDKVAIVTGASAGIGEATARELAAAGATLVLTARRASLLEKLAAELGGATAIFAADLAEETQLQRLLDFVLARFGKADLLVNNAGILRIGNSATFDLAALRPMIAINYEAVVRASFVFARAMKAEGQGHIINISSIGANILTPDTGIYGGLKKALEAFTDALRIEMAGTGVRVGLIAPGTTSTEIFADMKSKGAPGWDEYIPPLEAADIARAVRYMAEQPARANVARMHVYSASEGF